jgi:beta-glucosidase
LEIIKNKKAYQIEGAPLQEGRGPSIWDVFCKLPNKTSNGDCGDRVNHYYQYETDVNNMKDLGIK